MGTASIVGMVKRESTPSPELGRASESPIRKRILEAAFAAFVERGYAETSTNEIASRARVSKRELYSLVGNKQQMLVACITERAASVGARVPMPIPRDREILARMLTDFGTRLLTEVTAPTTMAVFRIAIAEAERTPEIAQALDSIAREASRAALREMLTQARSARLLGAADVAEMSEQFLALLWGNWMINLLLRVACPPNPKEIEKRALDAATAFLQLHPRS
jgi:AcrR family transcriptional regulator